MRAVRYIGVGIATLGIAAAVAAPVSATPLRAHHNVYLAQIRYEAMPGMGSNGEYVKLTNGHNYYVNLVGWTLTEGYLGHRYTFPDKWLAPHASVWLYSGPGLNGGANLHWNSATPIWHNNGDKATLRNGRHTLIETGSWKSRGVGYVNSLN